MGELGREEAPGVFMNVILGRSVERSIGVGPGCELCSAREQGEQGAGRSNPEWESRTQCLSLSRGSGRGQQREGPGAQLGQKNAH